MNGTTIMPCPHCGGVSALCSSYSNRRRIYFVFVKCEICGAQGKTFADDVDPYENEWSDMPCENAIAAWNMRTDKENE